MARRVDAVITRRDGSIELRFSEWDKPEWEGQALLFQNEAALQEYLGARPSRMEIEAKRG